MQNKLWPFFHYNNGQYIYRSGLLLSEGDFFVILSSLCTMLHCHLFPRFVAPLSAHVTLKTAVKTTVLFVLKAFINEQSASPQQSTHPHPPPPLAHHISLVKPMGLRHRNATPPPQSVLDLTDRQNKSQHHSLGVHPLCLGSDRVPRLTGLTWHRHEDQRRNYEPNRSVNWRRGSLLPPLCGSSDHTPRSIPNCPLTWQSNTRGSWVTWCPDQWLVNLTLWVEVVPSNVYKYKQEVHTQNY